MIGGYEKFNCATRPLQTQVKIPHLFMSLQAKRSNLMHKGSAGKLKIQLYISKEVGYVKDKEYQELNERLREDKLNDRKSDQGSEEEQVKCFSRLSRITTFLAVFSFSPFPLSLVSRILTVKYFIHLPLDKSNFNLIDSSRHE